jgi:peptidoglycan/xylan/chitin deacetylase (PgdA/CDA1 family)
MVLAIAVIAPAEATIASPAKPKISFTFDDGRASTYTYAAPILAKYGLSGTAFITTNCVGMTTTPNTCRAAQDVPYMSWTQVQALKNTYNWEIGSHSETHPYMASTNANDGQPLPLTDQQIINELRNSKAQLAARGIDATAYASPYGDYSPFVLQEVGKLYTSHRGFADTRDNIWPYNDLLLNNMQVQGMVTASDVKAKIDYSIANNTWLVLSLHDVLPKASKNNNKYQWSAAALEQVAAYVKAKRDQGLIQAVNASGGLATPTTNVLPGADFPDGINNGWRTSQPSIFTADAGNNGAYPESTHSIRFNANTLTSDAHLTSPMIAVDSNSMYLYKSFLNVKSLDTGAGVGFYIDEYDSMGNWVSWQHKAQERTVFAEYLNFSYVPSSVAVKQATITVYTTAGGKATGFVDSMRFSAVSSSTPVTQTNLLPSGTFDSPWTTGWSTDDTAGVKHDTASHGAPANPVNSVSVAIAGRTSHLFSPKITVDATRTYYLEEWFNITSTSGGEIGIYIDEYDTAGNWVSGQYKTTYRALGPNTVGISYKPTSTGVAKAQLQFIFSANSGSLNAYVDNSRWTQL